MVSNKPDITGQSKLEVQTISVVGDQLYKRLPASYETYRLLRKDPTVALARILSVAPILASPWTIEVDEGWEKAKELIEEDVLELKSMYLETALFGGCDFGWQGYEEVFEAREGLTHLRKLKPLLQDLTIILLEKETGRFAGFRQGTVDLNPENCLLVNFRVEADELYGESLLENIRKAVNDWNVVNRSAERYDAKIAGSHWVVHYPPGTTVVNGVQKDNAAVAKELLQAMISSGAAAIPSGVLRDEDGNEVPGWKIELVNDGGGKQGSFIERQKYLDVLKVRGLIMPERAVLEGQFGTKAEAGTHGDLALMHAELLHQRVVRFLNRYLVNRLLQLNWGDEAMNTVRIVPAPMNDEQKAFYRDLYEKMLVNPQVLMAEYASMEMKELRRTLGVPEATEEDMALLEALANEDEDEDDTDLDEPDPTELENDDE